MTDVIDATPTALVTQPTPASLLALAVQRGADLDQLERLMALQERWEATEARKAFVVAMNAFKAEPLVIFKRQEVDFTSSKGRTNYRHATLSDVTDVVGPAMARHGLSYRWNVRQEAKQVEVMCIVTHALGHAEQVSMSGPLDDTGNKNPIQQAGSTVTYLQRYTLLAVTGLSTQEGDDDGRGGDDDAAEDDDEMLADFQAAALEGEQALRTRYQSAPPPDAWWAKHSPALKQAAKAADRDAK